MRNYVHGGFLTAPPAPTPLQPRDEREFPFPTIFRNTGLRFPFPKFGNEFFIPVPVPKSWECFFDSRSRSQNLGTEFSIPVPITGNGLSCREKNGNGVQKFGFRGLLTDKIDPLDISLGFPWRIHHNKWKLGQQILVLVLILGLFSAFFL